MVVAIIALLMLITAIVMLLKKRRGRLLLINLFSMAFYESVIIVLAMNAKGWDGLGFLLLALLAGGLHLLILFSLSLALPDRRAKPVRPATDPFLELPTPQDIHKAMQQLPEQDRKALPKQQFAARASAEKKASPTPRMVPQVKTTEPAALSEWELRQQSLLSRLDNHAGGELPFDS